MILVKNVKTTKTILSLVFYTPTLNAVKEMIIWDDMIYLNNLFFWTSEDLFHTFISFLHWKDEMQNIFFKNFRPYFWHNKDHNFWRNLFFFLLLCFNNWSSIYFERMLNYDANLSRTRFLFSWNCDVINTRNSLLRTNQ